jgi:signal peptidase I
VAPANIARYARRALVLASAVFVAFLISGGIFTFTPLIGYSVAHASGRSMSPQNQDGDVVLLERIQGSDAQVGDVIVFEFGEEYVMHRVVERRLTADQQLLLITQGDNVPVPDRPILASQVKARYVAEIPLLGSLSRLLDARGGLYVYRSIVLTLAVSIVVVWGLTTSARRRAETRALEYAAVLREDAPAPRENQGL